MIHQPNPQPPVTSTTTILLLHCCNNATNTLITLLLLLLLLSSSSSSSCSHSLCLLLQRLQALCNNKQKNEQPAGGRDDCNTHQTTRDKGALEAQQQSVHIRYTDAQTTTVAERRGLRQAAAFWLLLAPVSIAVNW